MKTKNILVFFLALASIAFMASAVSAADVVTIDSVKVNGIYTATSDVAVVAGESIVVEIQYTGNVDASDVKIKVELEGEKVDVEDSVSALTVEDGMTSKKVFTLKVPYELKDSVNDDLSLNVKFWNGEYKTELNDIQLRVQRPSYNADVMSIDASQTVEAGALYPVDVVLKNIGYNKLDDLYVTVKISALNVERTAYFGDIVAVEDDNNDDYERGRVFLQIPYDAEAGLYSIEVEASNDDMTINEAKQIYVSNDVSSNLIATESRKVAAAGQDVEYDLLVVNPTNKLKVYRIVVESSSDVTASSNVALLAVPAGLSKSVTVTAVANSEGEHTFNVNVLSGEELVETTTLELSAKGKAANSSVIALTVVLVIIFLVLVAVLVVLLGKKPKKEDDFGESYY